MTSIILNIEAGENGLCGECRNFFQEPDGPAFCEQITWMGEHLWIIGKGIQLEKTGEGWKRCPACLEAESRLTALVEAFRTLDWLRTVYPHVDLSKIDQALAAVKEGKP